MDIKKEDNSVSNRCSFDDDGIIDNSYHNQQSNATSLENDCKVEIVSQTSPRIKYNADDSDDGDDFESFLVSVRTPKQTHWIDSPELADNVNDFIIDDDCFIEEDEKDLKEVFVIDDDSDDDKENFCTPVQFETPIQTKGNEQNECFKTPLNEVTSAKAKPVSSSLRTECFKTPLCVNKQEKTRHLTDIERIITPYSTQKEFKKSRDVVVKELFHLYNSTIFENKLPQDFSVKWNNKMRSTAGFCYYGRKNGIATARIELADKVIDSAARLRDTLVHEMCHAAAWLIDGIRAGHGPVWKKWASRANFIHQDLPRISRCHSYKINTKYIYQCTNKFCSNTVGRHSKSLDLNKYFCSYCHSRFELQPQLKKDGTPQSSRAPNKFALFVKDNYSKVKQAGMAHKDVMKELSSQFSSLSTK